jgi:hypothetical protein
VNKEEGEGAKALTVRAMFEASRLSKDSLVLVYDRLVPNRRSDLRVVRQNEQVERLRQEGGYEHNSSHLRAS